MHKAPIIGQVLLVAVHLVACGGGSAAQLTSSGAPVATPSTAPAASASAAASVDPAPTAAPGRARLQPSSGAYFGLNLDWGNETVAQASESLGRTPAVWVQWA